MLVNSRALKMKITLREILSNPEDLPETWLYLPQEKWNLDTKGVFSEDSWDYPLDSDEYLPVEVKKYGWIEVLDKASIEDITSYTKNQLANPTLEQLLEAMIFYYKNDAFLDF